MSIKLHPIKYLKEQMEYKRQLSDCVSFCTSLYSKTRYVHFSFDIYKSNYTIPLNLRYTYSHKDDLGDNSLGLLNFQKFFSITNKILMINGDYTLEVFGRYDVEPEYNIVSEIIDRLTNEGISVPTLLTSIKDNKIETFYNNSNDTFLSEYNYAVNDSITLKVFCLYDKKGNCEVHLQFFTVSNKEVYYPLYYFSDKFNMPSVVFTYGEYFALQSIESAYGEKISFRYENSLPIITILIIKK